jgi:hypothetical protein
MYMTWNGCSMLNKHRALNYLPDGQSGNANIKTSLNKHLLSLTHPKSPYRTPPTTHSYV